LSFSLIKFKNVNNLVKIFVSVFALEFKKLNNASIPPEIEKNKI
jgi:hypothetical protein